MKTIRIDSFENGAHANQFGTFSEVPDGWAIIPDDLEIPATFPFVNLETAEVDGVTTVTSMTAGTMPDPEPEPEPEPTAEGRLFALESQLAQSDETAIELYEAQAAQDDINAQQDESLLELYEMMGG